jgi:hypothetical protein
MDILRQRVPLTTCARCRKKLLPGDRVITAMIVQKVGYNADSKDMGAYLGHEFELTHVDCLDPSLAGKLIS